MFTSEQAIRLHYLTQQEINKIQKEIKMFNKKLKINKNRFITGTIFDTISSEEYHRMDVVEPQLRVLRKLMRKAMK